VIGAPQQPLSISPQHDRITAKSCPEMHAGLEVLCPSATSADPIFFTRNLTAIRAESRLVLANPPHRRLRDPRRDSCNHSKRVWVKSSFGGR